jgi:hypothetical protein
MLTAVITVIANVNSLMSHTELVHKRIPIDGPTRLKHRAKQKDLVHPFMCTHMIKQQINSKPQLEPQRTHNSQHHTFLWDYRVHLLRWNVLLFTR